APAVAARLLAAAPQLAQNENLIWAARREAVAGLALPPGAFRWLGRLVATRGLRVCELTFSAERPPQGAELRTGVAGRLALGWLRRRFEPHRASELVPS